MAATPSYFTPAFFTFFKALKRHNRREWFAANKARYQRDVEQPLQVFVTDLAPRLRAISPRFVADPRRTGASIFRIYRDTRFSADKRPFKTWAAARFPHDARGEMDSVPGFYLHLEPDDVAAGGGIYHPVPAALLRIRQHIVAAPREWRAVLAHGLEIEGDALTRVPAGFDKSHPHAEHLKRKDHYALAAFTERDACAPGFLDRYVDACERVAPLVRFLTGALGLRWT